MFDNATSAQIDMAFDSPVSVSSILLSFSNAETISLALTSGGTPVFSETIENRDYINRIVFDPITVDGGTVVLSGSKDNDFIYLGALYMGEALTIPRFVVKPKMGEEFLESSKRSFGGYTYGLDGETLRTLEAEFVRINKFDYLNILRYLRTVTKTIPHYIDAYEGANDVWPILYGTFDGNFEPEKRDENDFYFDFSLQWKEAK
jgi:hypothetical protein